MDKYRLKFISRRLQMPSGNKTIKNHVEDSPRFAVSTPNGRSLNRRLPVLLLAASALLAPSAYGQGPAWVTMADQEFAQQYAKQATGDTLTEQSTVAWMLFARVNQPKQLKGSSYSTWEVWPSNDDTFSPAVNAFVLANKVRNRPHLEQSKVHELIMRTRGLQATQVVGQVKAGEEVTRNEISYHYIMKNKLNSATTAWKRLSTGPDLNFSIGSVEIKADWVVGSLPGAYTFTVADGGGVFSLAGLHIAAKVAPTPGDPFHSEDPSWFWTTFEFKGNPGLANAQSFLTYKDALTRSQSLVLLAQAGLEKGPFVNYVCNGTQIRYSDAKNPTIKLGNTTMENFSFTPTNASSPADWKTWSVSCHSCHGTGSATGVGNNGGPGNLTINTWFFNNDVIGPLPPASIPSGAKSFDFVWSIWRAR
jgi:hypothetical protein